jgi:hypothetical protein
MIRFLGRVLLPALVVCVAGCQKVETAPPAPLKPEMKVKADELLKAFSGNAVAAEAKYKGKVLAVSGKFGSAQKAPIYGFAVQLIPDDAPDVNTSNVLCMILESAKDDVAKLKENDPITVVGMCDGQVVGQVKMTKCTLQK